MAEKTIIVDIDIKAEDIKAASEAMTKARAETVELNRQLNELKKQQKESAALFKVGAIDAKEYAKQQTQIKGEISEVNKNIREANKTLQNNKTVVDAAKGSNDQLRARLSLLTREYNALSKEERENSKTGQQLQATIKGISDKLKANEKAVGDNRRNVGNYESALKGVAGQINVMGVNLGSLASQLQTYKEGVVASVAATKASTAATGGLSGAMNILKVALISTGIGAIVVALGSMVAFLTQTKRGAELLSQAMSGLGAVMSVITDRLSSIGEGMVNAFKNPKQSLIDLGELIKSQIVNRLTAIPALLKATSDGFQALAKRDLAAMKEAAKDAGQAIIQFQTGLDPAQQKKIADGIKGVTQEIAAEAKAAADLEKQMQQLRDRERELLVDISKRKAEVAELRLIAEDETKSFKERQAAIQRANAIQEEQMNRELELQRERVRIIEEQLALGENLEEDEQRLAEERAKLGDIEAGNLKMLRSLKAKENSIAKQEAAQLLKIENEKRKLSDEQIKKEEEAAKKREEIREQFRREQLTELERRKEDALKRANQLREAGENEKAIEQFLSQELIEINRGEQDAILNAKLKRLDDEAQAARLKVQTEISDAETRKMALLAIDQELALAKQQELDLEIMNYQASTEAIGFVDEERNAQLLQRKAEVDAQVVELDRQKTDQLKAHEDELTAKRQQENQKYVSAVSGTLGSFGSILTGFSDQIQANIKQTEEQAKAAGKTDEEIAAMTKERRREAHELAVAAAIVQTLQAAIAAYQSGSSIPIVGVALGPIMAAAALAFGFAQVGQMKQQKFSDGGVAQGPSHAQGGIPFTVAGHGGYEMEGDEIILTKGVYRNPVLREQASYLNQLGGGTALTPGSYMAAGGVASATVATRGASANTTAVLEARIDNLGNRIAEMQPIVKVTDINRVNGQLVKVQSTSDL